MSHANALTLVVAALTSLSVALTAPRPTPAAPAAGEDPAPARVLRGVALQAVPAGTYALGCAPTDTRCEPDEPAAHVEAVGAFLLAATETTRDQWAACVADGACPETPSAGWCGFVVASGDEPVSCVSADEAAGFCAWLGGRLPTATEWEAAARADGPAIYPWGDAPPLASRARFGGLYDGPDPVASRPGGSLGLHDLAGNVREWTSSAYDDEMIEVRGGSWNNGPRQLRTSNRGGHQPGIRSVGVGFRCAADA